MGLDVETHLLVARIVELLDAIDATELVPDLDDITDIRAANKKIQDTLDVIRDMTHD